MVHLHNREARRAILLHVEVAAVGFLTAIVATLYAAGGA